VTWDEVEGAAGGEPLSFETADVLARVDDLGDLFAPTLTLKQRLPDSSP
jgi:bifunctional non-homologous end joining protein LigD